MIQGTQEDYIPSNQEMERLFVNNETLSTIEAYTMRFNPIKVMKMERMEIRHSAILSWLLSPSETHGFGDRFLKAFLAQALVGQNRRKKPNALDISRSDLQDADVRCEWQNIDIFILIESKKWGFVIENKVKSKRKDSQLEKYLARVKKDDKTQKRKTKFCGVFLTLQDDESEDSNFASINYTDIYEILSSIWKQYTHLNSGEVGVFIQHYLEILEEMTGMSKKHEEIKDLAKQLYQENKKVLDFVIEHGVSNEFSTAVRTVFGDSKRGDSVPINDRHYIFSKLESKRVSFMPEGWHEKMKENKDNWLGCEKWFLNFPLIIWLPISTNSNNIGGKLTLYAEVGPLSNHEIRNKLIHYIKKEFSDPKDKSLVGFQKGVEGKKFSRFLKNNRKSIKDINDSDEMAKAMTDLLKKFEHVFDVIDEKVLPNFMKDVAKASKNKTIE